MIGKKGKIINECGTYDPTINEKMKWLQEHSGEIVEIIGDNGDIALTAYRIKANDGTENWCWERELKIL